MVKFEACYVEGTKGSWSEIQMVDFHEPEDLNSTIVALQDFLTGYVPPSAAVALRITTDENTAYIRIHPKWGMVPKFEGADTIWPDNDEVGGVWEVPHVLPDAYSSTGCGVRIGQRGWL